MTRPTTNTRPVRRRTVDRSGSPRPSGTRFHPLPRKREGMPANGPLSLRNGLTSISSSSMGPYDTRPGRFLAPVPSRSGRPDACGGDGSRPPTATPTVRQASRIPHTSAPSSQARIAAAAHAGTGGTCRPIHATNRPHPARHASTGMRRRTATPRSVHAQTLTGVKRRAFRVRGAPSRPPWRPAGARPRCPGHAVGGSCDCRPHAARSPDS